MTLIVIGNNNNLIKQAEAQQYKQCKNNITKEIQHMIQQISYTYTPTLFMKKKMLRGLGQIIL